MDSQMWRKFSAVEIYFNKCANIKYCISGWRFCSVHWCIQGRDRWIHHSKRACSTCYESQKFKEHDDNYATHDLELVAIVHELKLSIHYLMGIRLELRKKHCGMKHLFGQPTLNARQNRWMEFLSEYAFEIMHIKGKENQVVDTLNTREHEMHYTTIRMYIYDLKDKIVEATI